MNQLLVIVAFIGGVIFGWLAWGRPLKGAIRVHAALKTELAKVRIERFDEGYEHGADVVRTLLRTAIAERIAALPPLACGRDPHLKLSEVLAVVRGEVPKVRRRATPAQIAERLKRSRTAPTACVYCERDAEWYVDGASMCEPCRASAKPDHPKARCQNPPVVIADPLTDRDAPDTGEVAA